MAWLPKSRKARRRLAIVAIAGVVLSGAATLVFFTLGDNISMYYTPSLAEQAKVPVDRRIQLGGFVENDSLVHHTDGSVEFVVTDYTKTARVYFKGDVPDLFRECQGVVAKGSFDAAGDFEATQILAKHDEKYQPRELEKILKESGATSADATNPMGCPSQTQQVSAR